MAMAVTKKKKRKKKDDPNFRPWSGALKGIIGNSPKRKDNSNENENGNANENDNENNRNDALSGVSDIARPLRRAPTFWSQLTLSKRDFISSFTTKDVFLAEYSIHIENQTEFDLVTSLSEIIDLIRFFDDISTKQRKILGVFILNKYQDDFQVALEQCQSQTQLVQGLTESTLSRAAIIKFLTNLSTNEDNKTEYVNENIFSKAAHIMSNVYIALGTSIVLHNTTQWAAMFRKLINGDGNANENENENGDDNANDNESENDFEIISTLLQTYFNLNSSNENMNTLVDSVHVDFLQQLLTSFEASWSNERNVVSDNIAAQTKKLNHTLNMCKALIRLPMLTICEKADSWFKKGGNRATILQIMNTFDYWKGIANSNNNNNNNNNNNIEIGNEMRNEMENQNIAEKIRFFTSTDSLRATIGTMLNEMRDQERDESETKTETETQSSDNQNNNDNNDNSNENNDKDRLCKDKSHNSHNSNDNNNDGESGKSKDEISE